MRCRTGAVATWTLAATVLGCGEPSERDQVIPLKQVPAEAMRAARKQLPDVIFETAWKVKDAAGQEDAYEIRGKTARGRIRDVKVTPSGKVLEVD